jgi:hypothetical protein
LISVLLLKEPLGLYQSQLRATHGLLAAGQNLQVAGIRADTSRAQQGISIDLRRQERELELARTQGNTKTLFDGAMGIADLAAGAMTGSPSAGAPVIVPIRTWAGISMNNTTTDARIAIARQTGNDQIQNLEVTTGDRIFANEQYTREAGKVADAQFRANVSAAREQRDISAGGVERAYQQQIEGIGKSYDLNLETNQIRYDSQTQAAETVRSATVEAARLHALEHVLSHFGSSMASGIRENLVMRF